MQGDDGPAAAVAVGVQFSEGLMFFLPLQVWYFKRTSRSCPNMQANQQTTKKDELPNGKTPLKYRKPAPNAFDDHN